MLPFCPEIHITLPRAYCLTWPLGLSGIVEGIPATSESSRLAAGSDATNCIAAPERRLSVGLKMLKDGYATM